MDAEQGGKDLWLRKTIFLPDFSMGNVEEIKEYSESFKKLSEQSYPQLSENLSVEAKEIIKLIDQEKEQLKKSLEGIEYVLNHPDVKYPINYTKSDLELANKLVIELQACKEELNKFLASRGTNLTDQEKELDVETSEEKVAYRELEVAINDTDIQELVANSQREMQILLDRIKEKDIFKREELIRKFNQEAIQLATQVAGVIEMLEAKQQAINLLYFEADTSDYVNRPIDEGVKKYKLLDTAIKNLNSTFIKFYIKFGIREPQSRSIYVITKEELKTALKSLVHQLAPNSKLVKATLGARPLPQTPEAWANLGLEVGFDFILYGKELKLLAGPDKPALQQQMKHLIVKLIEKRTLKSK